MKKLDDIDKEIIKIMQDNCRITVKELSERLGLSATPVFERIKKLENTGVIQKYVALIDPIKLGRKLIAFLHVSIKGHSSDSLNQFIDYITELDEVMECYHVTGEFDFIIKVVTRDMESYNQFILTKLSVVPNISRVHSQFSLSVRKNTTAYTLPSDDH